MYDELVLALPFQSAIQTWSGMVSGLFGATRWSSIILMPDAALE